MSTIITGREIDAVIFDVDGTFYSQSILNKVFDNVREQIAVRLLGFSGNIQPTPHEVKKKKEEYITLAETCGSFSHAYAHLGGTVEEFCQVPHFRDRPSKAWNCCLN